MNILANLGFGVACLLIGIYLHEWGHMYTLRRYNVKGKMSWRDWDFVVEYNQLLLTYREEAIMLLSGIAMGLIPFAFLGIVMDATQWFLWLAIYIVGCKHDLKRLIQLDKLIHPEVYDE